MNTHAGKYRHHYLMFLLCSLSIALMVTIQVAARSAIFQLSTERLAVSDPRPVALAAEMLEKKYGWAITYEDPVYAYEGDLVDVTKQVVRNLDKFKPGEAPQVLIPKGGDLCFEYDIDPATQKPANAAIVIQQLLDAYASAGNPGVFRLEQNGQRVHIIGIAGKAKNGVLTPQRSVFDTLITVPAQKRNGLELLSALCDAISKASGIPVVVGSAPLNQFYRYETEAGAKDQQAREFLDNELDRMTKNGKLSWQLLYSASLKTYYLNVHRVPAAINPSLSVQSVACFIIHDMNNRRRSSAVPTQ